MWACVKGEFVLSPPAFWVMEIGLATGSNMFEMLNSRTDGHTHIQKQKESYCYSLILTRITGLDTPAAAEAESCSAVFLP